jgi:pheromone shutdown protein TraB
MANRLSALRTDGTVVAVVGVDHLDPLAARLE